MDNDDDLKAEIMHKLQERYMAIHEELSRELIGDLENWRPTGFLRGPVAEDGASQSDAPS